MEQLVAYTLLSAHFTSYTDNYLCSSIGSDYVLKKIIIMIEYHYNDAGSNNAEDYTELATEAPYQKAGV